MANLQHSTLAHASVHEPKHISINTQSASGKVITNSSSSSAVSEYRNLVQADINNLQVLWQLQEFDGTVQQTHYIPATFNGNIIEIAGIVNIAVAGGSNTYELQIAGVQVTNSIVTFTTTPGSGGTAGDIVTATISGADNFAIGQVITIVNTSKNNTEATLDINFIITVERA